MFPAWVPLIMQSAARWAKILFCLRQDAPKFVLITGRVAKICIHLRRNRHNWTFNATLNSADCHLRIWLIATFEFGWCHCLIRLIATFQSGWLPFPDLVRCQITWAWVPLMTGVTAITEFLLHFWKRLMAKHFWRWLMAKHFPWKS